MSRGAADPGASLVDGRPRAAGSVSSDIGNLHDVLDSTPLCHIACIDKQGFALFPTLCWREENRLFWHGSPGSRLVRAAAGRPVSVAVTRFNGLVLAHSAFHHSANYACALIEGTAEACPDFEKATHLRRLMESLFYNRWPVVRHPNASELKATTVLSVSLDRATVKSRTGNVVEDADDQLVPAWAGVIEFSQVLKYLPDPACPSAKAFACPELRRSGRVA